MTSGAQGRGGRVRSSVHDSASARPRLGRCVRDLFFLAPGHDIIFEVATWEVKSLHSFGARVTRTKWPQVATWKNGVST